MMGFKTSFYNYNITTIEIGRKWFNPAIAPLRVFAVAHMFSDLNVSSGVNVYLICPSVL